MFTFKKKDTILALVEDAIEDCAEKMLKHDVDSPEYAKHNEQMFKLIEQRTKMKSSSKISADTLAVIIANLAGILIVLNYERVNVISSKAFGSIAKLKM